MITATENFVTMAEDLEGSNLRIQFIADGGTSATNAEKAWHFYFGGLNSGFMYYGKSEDMEVKQSMTGNIAFDYARKVINANPNTDNTAPSVFIPQRFPYNPGSVGFGPTTGYKKVNYASDFHVWTYAYDISGLSSVTLKYRTDKDGWNPVESIQNDTYAGGSEVNEWTEIAMTRQPMAADPTADADLNFFILPEAKADLCFAEIKGLKDTLVDYFVEAVDLKGNVFKTPIQHVYIGTGDGDTGGGTSGNVSWTPTAPTSDSIITITCKNATATSKLHWGVNNWTTANAAYHPAGTTASTGGAVETPFTLVNGNWQVALGPFNNPAQAVSKINFVINHNGTWDNNNGSDYLINLPVVIDPNAQPITVSFKKPTDWGTTGISIWAWNSGGNLFNSWPGVQMTDQGNGWYSYTFESSVSTVNVIFSKAGSPQTVDITGITQTTCFQSNGLSGSKINVSVVNCPTTAVENPSSTMKMTVYPQPVKDRFVLELPNIGSANTFQLSITDLNGRTVKTETFTASSALIERENIAPGFYILQVISENNEIQLSSKVVFR